MTTRTRRVRVGGAGSAGWQDHVLPRPKTTLDVILEGLPLERGNCYDTSINMFPQGNTLAERDALALCKGCPIRKDCLRMALDYEDQHGVWGGVSAPDRRRMKLADTNVIRPFVGRLAGVQGRKIVAS